MILGEEVSIIIETSLLTTYSELLLCDAISYPIIFPVHISSFTRNNCCIFNFTSRHFFCLDRRRGLGIFHLY